MDWSTSIGCEESRKEKKVHISAPLCIPATCNIGPGAMDQTAEERNLARGRIILYAEPIKIDSQDSRPRFAVYWDWLGATCLVLQLLAEWQKESLTIH